MMWINMLYVVLKLDTWALFDPNKSTVLFIMEENI